MEIHREFLVWDSKQKNTSFIDSSSFVTDSSKVESDPNISVDEDEIEDMINKKFKLIRRHSCY